MTIRFYLKKNFMERILKQCSDLHGSLKIFKLKKKNKRKNLFFSFSMLLLKLYLKKIKLF